MSERKKRKLTPEIEQKIIELNSLGLGQRDIAKEIGLSRQVIQDVYEKHNLTGLPNGKITKDMGEKIIKLYNEGNSTPEIAKMFDLNRNTVQKFLKKKGIDLSPFHITDEIAEQIMNLRSNGSGTREIAKILDCARNTIKIFFENLGIINSNPPPKPKKELIEKFCVLCEEIKPISEFEKQPRTLVDGTKSFSYKNKCFSCMKIRQYISLYIHRRIRNQFDFKLDKQSSCLEYLPYTMKELKVHIESLFEPWMTWKNRGNYNAKTWNDNDPTTWTWQLDHIIPHSTFKYTSMEDQSFQDCWTLSNLRPYSAKLNIIDGASRIRHELSI